jgi:diguanylate cyclase (GGDEF)-like protein
MKGWGVHGLAAALVAAFLVTLVFPDLGAQTVLAVSDGTQLLAATLASACAGVAAVRSDRRRRVAWVLLSLGAGSWAAGQAVWTLYELGMGREVPFPSAADVGFVLFPLLAAAGLLTWSRLGDTLAARLRDVFDGAIIAASLLVLSWVTALGSVVAAGGRSTLSLALSISYPVGDVVLGTLALRALARGRADDRSALLLLVAGLGALATADSAYVYLVAERSYSSADWVSAGWVAGFGLVASSAVLAVRRRPGRAQQRHAAPDRGEVGAPSLVGLLAPYLPLPVAGGALLSNALHAPTVPAADMLLGAGLATLVLLRQFLAMAENRRLVIALRQARDLLHHQALHDPLTGLPNRTLFDERLDRALLAREHDLAVLFCDVDDFKRINDDYGHDAGDEVLRQVASRLLDCVRTTDTVARLGGDEFAILVLDALDVAELGERLVAALAAPYHLAGTTVQISASIGIAEHHAVHAGRARRVHDRRFARRPAALAEEEREALARALLTRADTAMYAAKRGGKNRAVAVEDPATDGTRPAAVGESTGT